MKKCLLCLEDKNDFNLSNRLTETYLETDGGLFSRHRSKLDNLLGSININLVSFARTEEVCSDCHNDIHYNYAMLEMKVKLIHS